MNPDPRDPFVHRLRTELERSAHELDASTVARLRAARRRALEAGPRRRLWLMAGGLAAGAVAAGVAAVLLLAPPALPLHGLDQLELIADADLDVVDDLEFYRWLADNPNAG
jgi:hypothetical protein